MVTTRDLVPLLVQPLSPDTDGVCSHCLGLKVNEGYQSCFKCGMAGGPPVSMFAVTLCDYLGRDSQIYRYIKVYKDLDGLHQQARSDAARIVVGVIARFLMDHTACIERELGGPWDLAGIIPSSRKPPPHPLFSALKRLRDPPHGLTHLLKSDQLADTKPRNATTGRFVPTADVGGKRVLLIDDLMVSGASIVSAANALRDAGAASVVALAMARGVILTPGSRAEQLYLVAKGSEFAWAECARHLVQ
jgi:predicted amidophosphoribosyltransferase